MAGKEQPIEGTEATELPSLAGKRILITRAASQTSDLSALLAEAGAEPVAVPTIRIEPPEDWQALDRAVAQLDRYDWIVFTSTNGVRGLFARLTLQGRTLATRRGLKIAVVGSATAQALAEHGHTPDFVPATFQAEDLAAGLREQGIEGADVLYVRAAEVSDVLGPALRQVGAKLDEVIAYRTVPDEEGAERLGQLLASGTLDAAIFASPSAVRGTLASLGTRAQFIWPVVACIGPVTARAAREAGLRADVVPAEHTLPALLRALALHFSQQERKE